MRKFKFRSYLAYASENERNLRLKTSYIAERIHVRPKV